MYIIIFIYNYIGFFSKNFFFKHVSLYFCLIDYLANRVQGRAMKVARTNYPRDLRGDAEICKHKAKENTLNAISMRQFFNLCLFQPNHTANSYNLKFYKMFEQWRFNITQHWSLLVKITYLRLLKFIMLE